MMKRLERKIRDCCYECINWQRILREPFCQVENDETLNVFQRDEVRDAGIKMTR
ncbi:MAG: hypothetical protein WBP64_17490 [Nitrososphaeraceae archaeon]